MTRRDEIAARLAAATPGPWDAAEGAEGAGDEGVWWVERRYTSTIATNLIGADADLIARAPDDLAWLLAERDAAVALAERQRDAIRELSRELVEVSQRSPQALTVLQLNTMTAERDAALAERDRLRHLLGSHADGHRCTCTMVDPGVYHGSNMHPPEWEQDPWCPTHGDVDYITGAFTEVQAQRDAALARAEAAEATVKDYEEGLNWNTTCLSCANVLTASYESHVRAEVAEATVERMEQALANPPLIVSEILRDLERNPGGRGGELHFYPSVEERGRSGCPGDNLMVWLTEFRVEGGGRSG